MDFAWVAQDDSNAIQNSIVDAKGDLIAATANDTPARLAVGNNGETLVADSSTSTGLRYTAGTVQDNPVLNSAYQIWQRGTSIAVTAGSTSVYTADRWQAYRGVSGMTVSRQATGDTTNLPNIQYCARIQRTVSDTNTSLLILANPFESVNAIPFAGKTVTLSFYARAGANFSAASNLLKAQVLTGTGTDQNFFVGVTGAATPLDGSATLTTTWQRFTVTGTLASTATQLFIQIYYTPSGTAGANDYFETTGVQIDIGSVALPFRTNGATIQGELSACQRYYYRQGGDSIYQPFASGVAESATAINYNIMFPVSMRVVPTSMDFANIGDLIVGVFAISGSFTNKWGGKTNCLLNWTAASGRTAGQASMLIANNSINAYIGFSAEL
jgi:hypothetical protein